jgi:hypothetical protein
MDRTRKSKAKKRNRQERLSWVKSSLKFLSLTFSWSTVLAKLSLIMEIHLKNRLAERAAAAKHILSNLYTTTGKATAKRLIAVFK